ISLARLGPDVGRAGYLSRRLRSAPRGESQANHSCRCNSLSRGRMAREARSMSDERTSARDSGEASTPDAVDVSVIIVSWNVRELLRGCIRSLLASESVRSEIIVVDN